MRGRTAEAMVLLILARLAIAVVPLPRWVGRIGRAGAPSRIELALAGRLAAHVRRAAGRLPFAAKCLPQALALSLMLRRRQAPHRLVIAARPAAARHGADDLHAWVECGETTVLGALPGEWVSLLAFP